jgi:hypothetical protein
MVAVENFEIVVKKFYKDVGFGNVVVDHTCPEKGPCVLCGESEDESFNIEE